MSSTNGYRTCNKNKVIYVNIIYSCIQKRNVEFNRHSTDGVGFRNPCIRELLMEIFTNLEPSYRSRHLELRAFRTQSLVHRYTEAPLSATKIYVKRKIIYKGILKSKIFRSKLSQKLRNYY